MLTNTGDIYSKNIINEDNIQSNNLKSNYIEIRNNTNNIIKINDENIQYSRDGTTYYNLIKPGETGEHSVILNDPLNEASGKYSHAEGGYATITHQHCIASGFGSHAEGCGTTASAEGTHAEGYDTHATADEAHAEGCYTKATGDSAHAEGKGKRNGQTITYLIASGNQAHAEGCLTTASGHQSHAEGSETTASGNQSHAGGLGTIADQVNMTAIGKYNTKNNSNALFVVGDGDGDADNARRDAFVVYNDGKIVSIDKTNNDNRIRLNPSTNKIQTTTNGGRDWNDYGGGGSNVGQFYQGSNYGEIFNDYAKNIASGDYSHAEGYNTNALGNQSHAEGYNTSSNGEFTHTEGKDTIAGNRTGAGTEQDPYVYTGNYSHAEGNNTTASGESSHAEGHNTHATGESSHAEGSGETTASGLGSHAEGGGTKSTYHYSHSEGVYTTASGQGAHAEGFTDYNNRDSSEIKTLASHKGSHAEGIETQAKNEGAHSEGYRTKAIGKNSHSGGEGTVADQINMTSIGQYNIYDADANPSLNLNKLFVVGNGTANNARSDAFVVYNSGNVELSGNLTLTDNTKQIQIGSFTIKSSNNGNTLTIQ